MEDRPFLFHFFDIFSWSFFRACLIYAFIYLFIRLGVIPPWVLRHRLGKGVYFRIRAKMATQLLVSLLISFYSIYHIIITNKYCARRNLGIIVPPFFCFCCCAERIQIISLIFVLFVGVNISDFFVKRVKSHMKIEIWPRLWYTQKAFFYMLAVKILAT